MSDFQITLKIPCTEAEIRDETARLSKEIKIRQAEVKILYEAVKHYQRQCTHPGQVTGSDYRDGSWGNPCPVCGYSY